MSRFGKKEEDQLRYKCEKLEKRIVMLLKHIENIEQSNRLYRIITSIHYDMEPTDAFAVAEEEI